MKPEHRHRITASLGLITLAVLTWITIGQPPDLADLVPGALFGGLLAFTMTFGVPIGGGWVSLLPMTEVAAYLVVGPALAGWAIVASALFNAGIRYRWAEQLGQPMEPGLLAGAGLAAANTTIQCTSLLVGGAVYQWLGGSVPLVSSELGAALSLIPFGLAYLGVNYLLVGGYFAMRGQPSAGRYLRSIPNMVVYEGPPLIIAPLVALAYTRLGLAYFVLSAAVLVVVSLIMRRLALAGERLERRVQELSSLQAVGQALSASLNLDTILQAIYAEVQRLMPSSNFFVALYDPDTNEVAFPFSVVDGKSRPWPSRRAGNGLTEYVLRTRKPLLIPRNVEAVLSELGLERIGPMSSSWLGIPILAGSEALGVMAALSYSEAERYDLSHQEILVTIAAQAAMAIQNARLYARTDEALARRLQELDSILRTTREGVLLLDVNWRVLTANRALTVLLGIPQVDLVGRVLTEPSPEGKAPLIQSLGYLPSELEAGCAALSQGERDLDKCAVTVRTPQERYLERTLTPVQDRDGETAGWLLVFRDLSEEREVARLRDELTHMLIHDLRSPLAVVKSSLEMIETEYLQETTPEPFDGLLGMAQSASTRMLHMVEELLEINKLESGQIPIRREVVSIPSLLEDVASRIKPLAAEARITLEVSAPQDLPPLYADPGHVNRVLSNLVDNAVKFTPDGGYVRLWAERDPQRISAVLLGVTDNGPGISPEAQVRLFMKFRQVISKSGRRNGTGLGLPFCKLAVEAHGGQIWVQSEVGRGSNFIVRLPLVPQELDPDR